MFGLISSILGFGSSVAGFFGQQDAADAATAGSRVAMEGIRLQAQSTIMQAKANVGLSMAAAREKALGYKNSQFQSDFAGALAQINGDLQATKVKVEAETEAININLSAGMQAIMYRLNGTLDQMQATFEADQLDRQAQGRRALGQDEMLEIARTLEFQQSEFQAQAAASGFQATDDSSIGVTAQSEELEAEGYFQARLAYARGEQEARDIGFQGDVRRAEGEISGIMNEYSATEALSNAKFSSNSIKRAAAIEANFYRANADLEASARKMEARGYADMARSAIEYGLAGKKAELAQLEAAKLSARAQIKSGQAQMQSASAQAGAQRSGAWSTLLGGAANFLGSMPQSSLSFPQITRGSNNSGSNYG